MNRKFNIKQSLAELLLFLASTLVVVLYCIEILNIGDKALDCNGWKIYYLAFLVQFFPMWIIVKVVFSSCYIKSKYFILMSNALACCLIISIQLVYFLTDYGIIIFYFIAGVTLIIIKSFFDWFKSLQSSW